LAGEVIKTLDVQLEEHRFVLDFPSRPLWASIDAGRIEQTLRNLLGNAIKYSPEGGTITVQGSRRRDQVLIRVADQGIGIPPGDLEHIFERFYRVESEVTENVRGAGLGLSVCRGIVELHGGHIWVESQPGVGSDFYFTLPVDGPNRDRLRGEGGGI
jgi:two-component system sensor histidine kinase VicK